MRIPEVIVIDGFGLDADEVRTILKDAVEMMTHEEAASLGDTIYIADSDLDRVWLSKDPEGETTDFIIRTWDIYEDGTVDWTLFEMVEDDDGSSHGEEICSGTTVI